MFGIEIDRENILSIMIFLAFLAMAGIANQSQIDAAFYCQKMCVAEGHEFQSYSLGSCGCRGNGMPLMNISNNGANTQFPILNLTFQK